MKKIALTMLCILIIGFGGWYGVKKAFTAPSSLLPEENVSQMIQQKYGGTIEDISVFQEKDKLNYSIKLIKDQIPYQVIVNGQTGEVLAMIKQTTAQKSAAPKPAEQKPAEQKPEEQKPATPQMNQQESIAKSNKNNQTNAFSSSALQTIITIDQAIGIALDKAQGTIDEVELGEEDGQLVYEVEIKQSEKKKSEVIINPYSGKVESISIDTHKDSDDGDDD
ncbi:PepSY domain-containing protein [Peribacillus huizhouensis]|uniref:Membrane protein YkoI n=1 Tax=Peribacillus huizhouensis TaxID=1501239 RepID=A0ABR6CN09_9BACI|nr:PepSY domain-containing protein [Peribacillus huizhouensis]MBA9025965.1 putative membrane protein YkoI [Peribacillus huizhouensis]